MSARSTLPLDREHWCGAVWGPCKEANDPEGLCPVHAELAANSLPTSDPSQTSANVDVAPEERAPEVSAQSAAATDGAA